MAQNDGSKRGAKFGCHFKRFNVCRKSVIKCIRKIYDSENNWKVNEGVLKEKRKEERYSKIRRSRNIKMDDEKRSSGGWQR